MYELRLGDKRAAAMNPFRAILARGIEVGGGSDSPVTPLDPWLGIRALESHHDASQRFTREEAMRVFTSARGPLRGAGARIGRVRCHHGPVRPTPVLTP